jgi:hypothetical protein
MGQTSVAAPPTSPSSRTVMATLGFGSSNTSDGYPEPVAEQNEPDARTVTRMGGVTFASHRSQPYRAASAMMEYQSQGSAWPAAWEAGSSEANLPEDGNDALVPGVCADAGPVVDSVLDMVAVALVMMAPRAVSEEHDKRAFAMRPRAHPRER